MISLKDKIVFITGASAGIGKATAEAFAREGANLIISARRIEKIKLLSEELRQKYDVKIFSFELDVTNREMVEQAIENLPADWKNIDYLINNAGLAKGLNKLHEDDPDNWEAMIDTNIKGLLYVTRKIVDLMIARKSGHVINLGSIAGHQGYGGGSVYCATKHAVKAITQSLRIDTLDKNIRVTSIDPGAVETDFSMIRFNGDEERAKNVYKGFDPLVAEDIAETIIFCATRPAHVNINEIIIMPTAQANAFVTHRK